jgi:hypothetical protein
MSATDTTTTTGNSPTRATTTDTTTADTTTGNSPTRATTTDTTAAPTAAPSPPWTCLSWPPDLNDPLEVRFWPPFHASKAGSFGTAIVSLILAVVVIVLLLVVNIVMVKSDGGKRNVRIAIGVVAFIGLFMVIGFSVLGMNYTSPEMETDETKRPGIFKKSEECGFIHSPWLSIVAIPGAAVLLGIVLMARKSGVAAKAYEKLGEMKERMSSKSSASSAPEASEPAAQVSQ